MQEKILIIRESSSKLIISLFTINDNKEIIQEKINKNKIYFNYKNEIKTLLDKLIKNNYPNFINEIVGIGYKLLNKENVDLDFINYINKSIPNAINVIMYDTSFHSTIIQNSFYEINNNETYGISHKSVTQYMKRIAARDDINFVSCYISNSANICGIKDGVSNNISLSITPLESLDKNDPNIIKFISEFKNLTFEDTKQILNTNNGLKKISDESDIDKLISLRKDGNEFAKIALDNYLKFIIKSIYESFVKLNGEVNAIVLTGKVGENSKEFRKMIVNRLSEVFDIFLNDYDNNKIGENEEYKVGVVTKTKSQIPIFVIPTNEEKIILEETIKAINKEKIVKKLIPNQ